ncbi:MAG TPA: ABC transporter permease [Polyangia bacterium]|nr:ABC transporter permease [Polyangia bacterium]
MKTRRLALLLSGVSFLGTATAAPGPRAAAHVAFAHPERLVVLKESQLPELPEMYVSPAMFRAWREQATSFASLGAFTPETYNLVGVGEPLRVSAALVSVNLFATLGVPPALGRDFAAGEDAPEKADVVILGHAFWRSRFGARADVLGRTVALDGRRVTIVGITPDGLEAPFAADVYRPLAYAPAVWESRAPHVIAFVIGRLEPGVVVDQAQQEVARISSALLSGAQLSGGVERRWGVHVIPLGEHLTNLAGPTVTPRGFEPRGTSTVSVTFARDRYPAGEPRAVFAQRLVDAVAKVPGVSGAGGASALPLSTEEWHNGFEIEGSPVPPTYPVGTTFSVTPGYFEVLRIPLLRGRLFDARDTAAAHPVAIISARAATRWPADVDPLGKRIKLYGSSRWLEVVGVVGEVSAGLYGRVETQVYQPFAQQPVGALSLVLRAATARASLADDVRAALRGVDPAQSASALRPLSETLVATMAPR